MDEIIFIFGLLIIVALFLVSSTLFLTYQLGELERIWNLVEKNRDLSLQLLKDEVNASNVSGETCFPHFNDENDEPSLICN